MQSGRCAYVWYGMGGGGGGGGGGGALRIEDEGLQISVIRLPNNITGRGLEGREQKSEKRAGVVCFYFPGCVLTLHANPHLVSSH